MFSEGSQCHKILIMDDRDGPAAKNLWSNQSKCEIQGNNPSPKKIFVLGISVAILLLGTPYKSDSVVIGLCIVNLPWWRDSEVNETMKGD